MVKSISVKYKPGELTLLTVVSNSLQNLISWVLIVILNSLSNSKNLELTLAIKSIFRVSHISFSLVLWILNSVYVYILLNEVSQKD